jgi:xanthine dehydrogenase accessory factor
VVFGVSPVARALVRLSKAMGYRVEVADPDARASELPDADRVFVDLDADELRISRAHEPVIVATMSEHDEKALIVALGMRPAYLGVVATPERFARLRQELAASGLAAPVIARAKNPAGAALGRRAPEDVALSIFNELSQALAAPQVRVAAHEREIDRDAADAAAAVIAARGRASERAPAQTFAIDPVCHVHVTIAAARHVGEWSNRRWYFCNPRCKDRFLADPHRYLVVPATGTEGGG